jgi:predicted O-methyltransferase YrrM
MEESYLGHDPQGNPYSTAPKWIYGYIRGYQMDVYTSAVLSIKKKTRRYCEIGVNGGHGTVAMLLADPGIEVVSFDLDAYSYSKKVYALLKMAFPGRIRIFTGSSYDTEHPRSKEKIAGSVPNFIKLVQEGKERPCDVILIDGDHRRAGAYQDILNMQQMAACENILLFDDLEQPSGYAFKEAEEKGVIAITKTERMSQVSLEKNPCLRWVGQPGCYAATDPAFIRQKCVKCIPQYGFATGRFKNPPLCHSN